MGEDVAAGRLQPEPDVISTARVRSVVFSRRVLALLVLALVVRLSGFPYWKDLTAGGDEGYYWPRAQAVASGNLRPDFFRPPLWSYVLAVAATVSPSPVAGRILSCLLGSFLVVWIYLLGLRLFDRRVATIAALIAVFAPDHIAYSHYLWSEIFFALIAVLVTDAVFRSLPDRPERALYVGSLTCGIALFAKEGAALVFAALVPTTLVLRPRVRLRVLVAGAVLFLTPVLVYSAWASDREGRLIVLADAPVFNANQIRHGREPWQKTPVENQQLWLDDVRSTTPKHIMWTLATQVAHLWTPNSFMIHRLMNASPAFGNYHAPHGRFLGYAAAFAYIALMVVGLTGLVFSARTPFKIFSASLMLALCASGAVFLLCSRFRVPFLFPLILYAGELLAHPCLAWSRAGDKVLLAVWSVVVLAFLWVVAAQWATIGEWG